MKSGSWPWLIRRDVAEAFQMFLVAVGFFHSMPNCFLGIHYAAAVAGTGALLPPPLALPTLGGYLVASGAHLCFRASGAAHPSIGLPRASLGRLCSIQGEDPPAALGRQGAETSACGLEAPPSFHSLLQSMLLLPCIATCFPCRLLCSPPSCLAQAAHCGGTLS